MAKSPLLKKKCPVKNDVATLKNGPVAGNPLFSLIIMKKNNYILYKLGEKVGFCPQIIFEVIL